MTMRARFGYYLSVAIFPTYVKINSRKGALVLRIIAGELKGRKLDMPADKLIRPTSGESEEALFSMVGPTLNGAVVIDLFSGTGSLGLEAISRGAKKVYLEKCQGRCPIDI